MRQVLLLHLTTLEGNKAYLNLSIVNSTTTKKTGKDEEMVVEEEEAQAGRRNKHLDDGMYI